MHFVDVTTYLCLSMVGAMIVYWIVFGCLMKFRWKASSAYTLRNYRVFAWIGYISLFTAWGIPVMVLASICVYHLNRCSGVFGSYGE